MVSENNIFLRLNEIKVGISELIDETSGMIFPGINRFIVLNHVAIVEGKVNFNFNWSKILLF